MNRLRLPAVLALLLVLALLFITAAPAHAQSQPPGTATIVGTVFGPDGARLPGVVITVRRDGAPAAQVVSGDQGVYRFSGVKPGQLAVRAELQGFRIVEMPLDVAGGGVLTLDLRMGLDVLRETVTVVGSAERGSVEPARIRESGARDVGEAVTAIAGVWKVRRGAIASDLVVRGYQGDNLTVLIDGARLYGACPNNMDHTSFHVDFAEVERIEVGKGPFDLKNQGGLGAAVNIVTKRPAEGFHFNPQLSLGSYGYVNPSLTASYGTRRAAFLGGYSYRQSDAYSDGSGRSFLQSANYRASALHGSAFDVSTAWARFDAATPETHAFQVGYTMQRAGEVLYPYLQMDAVYDDADRVNARYDFKRPVGFVRSITAQGYYTRVAHWMTDARRVSSIGMAREYSMATMANTDTQGGKIEAAVPGGTVGVELYRRGWDARTQLAMAKYQPQYSIPGVGLTSLGFYGEFSTPLGARWRLDTGARVDRSRNDADAALANGALFVAYHGGSRTSATDVYPSGKVRVAYQVMPALTLTAGVGHTVRVPDPQERYFGLRRMGSDWVGNPFLRPTKNTGLEMSVAYRAGRVWVNGSVHRDALTDAIGVYQQARRAAVPGIVNTVARSFRNVDATMSGAEVEAVLPLTDRLFLAGDVSVVRGRQKTNAAAGIGSPWMAEMPPTRSRVALRYQGRVLGRSSFAEVETVYSARQARVDTDLRESPTPAYSTTNARAGATIGKLRVAMGVANLFDRAYVEHLSYQRDPFRYGSKVYEPGRNLYANLSVVF